MDALRLNSFRTLQWIQQSVGLHTSLTEVFRSFAWMFESYNFYFIIFPICQIVHPILGHKMLFSFILAELACVLLKCIIHDDRPPWWFQALEYSRNGAKENTFYEFPETCENTSGFPSIHTAIVGAFSCVLYTFVQDINHISGASHGSKSYQVLKAILIPELIVINALAYIGRMFVGTNFHYQLLAGTVIGLLAGNYASSNTTRLFAFNKSRSWTFLWTIIGSLVVVLIGCAIANWDPFWGIELILNSCWTTAHAYRHLKYNLGYYMMRMVGMTLGMVLSNNYGGIWDDIRSFNSLEKLTISVLYSIEMLIMYWLHFSGYFNMIVLYLIQVSILSIFHVVFVTSVLPKLGIRVASFLDSKVKYYNAHILF